MKNKTVNLFLFSAVILIFLMFIGGIKPMIVMSGSMEPEIPTGSLCFLNSRADFNEVKENDVITYNLLDGKITHRAVRINDHGIITKGDANDVEDIGIVTKDNFEGKVIFHIPYAGYVFFYMRKHFELLIALVILAFIPYRKIFKVRRA